MRCWWLWWKGNFDNVDGTSGASPGVICAFALLTVLSSWMTLSPFQSFLMLSSLLHKNIIHVTALPSH